MKSEDLTIFHCLGKEKGTHVSLETRPGSAGRKGGSFCSPFLFCASKKAERDASHRQSGHASQAALLARTSCRSYTRPETTLPVVSARAAPWLSIATLEESRRQQRSRDQKAATKRPCAYSPHRAENAEQS